MLKKKGESLRRLFLNGRKEEKQNGTSKRGWSSGVLQGVKRLWSLPCMDSIGTELHIVPDSAAKDRSGRDRHGVFWICYISLFLYY